MVCSGGGVPMKYGDGFWVVENGVRLGSRELPLTKGFEYPDGSGDWGEFLLRDFTVDYLPPGMTYPLRMTVTGSMTPVLHETSFDWDFASIPKIFRSMVCDKADPRIRVGSLFHDMGYCIHDVLPFMDKAFWDRMLIEVSEAYGMPWATRQLVMAGVKAGGWAAWPKSASSIAVYRKLFSVEQVPL